MRDDMLLKKLGEVCDFQNGFAFKSKTFRETGVPVIRISDIQDERIDTSKIVYVNTNDYKKDLSRYEIVKNDLLIAMSGATTGKIGFVEEDQRFLLNQRVGKFEPKKDLDKKYLFYFLSTKVEESLAISAGSAQPNLSTKQIKNFKIPIPPLHEQKRIVEILDEAFEAIDQAKSNIERNIENAEELFQSKLNEIFSQSGEGWEEKSLKETCEVRPSKRQVKNKMNDDELVSFIPMSHLEINKKYFDEESIKPLGEVYKGYTYFEDGDVLLAKITPCFENGKLGIASNLENGVGFGSSEYIVYRPYDGLLNEYLYYFLNRDTFRRIGESLMGGAVGHQRIQKEFYEDFTISYPEFSKQKEIVNELDAISAEKVELVSLFKRKRAALEELKKSILQKAFSGELTANEQIPA